MSAPDDAKHRPPRPRRVPKTRAAQARADAVAELFRPAPFVIDAEQASRSFDERLKHWFAEKGWQPFDFQREVWREIAHGSSGLLHATTGAGKTWAVWLGALAAFAQSGSPRRCPRRSRSCGSRRCARSPPIPPARCKSAVTALAVPWTRRPAHRRHAVGRARAAEPPHAVGARHDARKPHADAHARRRAAKNSRTCGSSSSTNGTSCSATSAARRRSSRSRASHTGVPALQVWGLSATLGNLAFAHDALLAPVKTPRVTVRGAQPKTLIVDTLIPDTIERFPWGGHLGMRQVGPVADEIERGAQFARLHQHALAVRRSGISALLEVAARLGRADRAASRLARSGSARVGRDVV